MRIFTAKQQAYRQRGMGLVEILVALAIGLAGMLVVVQTITVWGARASSSLSGGDAQSTGSIAMHYLERDLREAGRGISSMNSGGAQFKQGCSVSNSGNNFTLAAVVITQGSDGKPDSLSVLYGDSDFSDVALFEPDKENAGKFYSLQGPAFAQNDWVIVANASTCGLAKVTSSTKSVNQIAFDRTPAVDRGNMLNLGGAAQRPVWSVQPVATEQPHISVLRRSDSIFASTVQDVGDGVIDLQAQYGLNPLVSGGSFVWQDTTPADSTSWARVRAIRVAILVRGKQFEKPTLCQVATPDANSPAWSGGTFVMRNLDGSAGSSLATCSVSVSPDPNDWHQYRYQVFEKTIPLRNLIWGAQ